MGGNTSYTNPNKLIAKESAYEKAAREALTSHAQSLLNSGNDAMNQYNQIFGGNYWANLNNQVQQRQEALANGMLPIAYQTNFENGIRGNVENTVGSALNNLGRRGIVNSSITNKSMNDIQKNVSSAAAQNYNASMANASNMNTTLMNNAINLNNNMLNSANNQYSPYYNMYNLWRQTRFGNKGEAMVSQSPVGGLLGGMMSFLKG